MTPTEKLNQLGWRIGTPGFTGAVIEQFLITNYIETNFEAITAYFPSYSDDCLCHA